VRSLIQFAAFQGLWFAAVLGAARGQPWLGAAVLIPFLALHRWGLGLGRAEVTRAVGLGLLGAALDGVLAGFGLLAYPGSTGDWPPFLVPPWIAALWVAFALLTPISLAWLARRPGLAVVLGAVGGAFSALAGVRMGALALGEPKGLSLAVLALEYAVATPLLLRLVPARAAQGPAQRG